MEGSVNHEWIGPDIRDSVFVHILHLLLIGGMVVYTWQAVTAFTRRPRRAFEGVRKAVYAAWLVVLFLLITKLNPMPYLGAAGFIAILLAAFSLWDRLSSPAPRAPDPRLPHGTA